MAAATTAIARRSMTPRPKRIAIRPTLHLVRWRRGAGRVARPCGVGRHFAATGAEVVFHDVRPLLLLSLRRLQVVAEIAAESWNSSCEFAIVHPPVGWRPREHASPG